MAPSRPADIGEFEDLPAAPAGRRGLAAALSVDTTLEQTGVSDDGPVVTPAGNASAEEGDH